MGPTSFRGVTTAILICLSVAACNEDQSNASREMAPRAAIGQGEHVDSAPMAYADDGSPKAETALPEKRTLAYKHHLVAEAPKEEIGRHIRSLSSVCAGLEGCLVLESSVNERSNHAQGRFRARAVPEHVQHLNGVLEQEGEGIDVVSRTTSAEDLAAPLTDVDRRLSMLRRQRNQLEALQEQAANDVDSLIKITQQLAHVQSAIEAAEGHSRSLRERVDMEVWTLQINAKASAGSTLEPLHQAVKDVPADLSRAAAMALSTLVILVPWLILILGFGYLLVFLMRRSRRGLRGCHS